MTDFLIILAKNYDGVAVLNKIYQQLYQNADEKKTCRFDPVFTQTVACLLNKSDKYVDRIYVVKVPNTLRYRCTIASNGDSTGGEKIYLLPSNIPDIRLPVIMSHDDVKVFITGVIAKLQSMRTPKPNTQIGYINNRHSMRTRANMNCLNNRLSDIPLLSHPTPKDDETLFTMYED
jgi:hypothetical protein